MMFCCAVQDAKMKLAIGELHSRMELAIGENMPIIVGVIYLIGLLSAGLPIVLVRLA